MRYYEAIWGLLILLVSLVPVGSVLAVVNSGIYNYYGGDNLTDQAGHISLTSSSPVYETGVIGNAYNTTTDGSHLVMSGSSPNIKSVCFWANHQQEILTSSSWATTHTVLTHQGGSGDLLNSIILGDHGALGSLTNEMITMINDYPSKGWYVTNAVIASISKGYHHYCFACDGSSKDTVLYFDGSPLGTMTKVGTSSCPYSPTFEIGRWVGESISYSWSGSVDEWINFNVTLTANAVKQIYDNQSSGYTYPLWDSVTPNNVPYLSSYNFLPVSVPDNTNINISVVYYDDDGDDINISVNWLVNNVSVLNDSSGFIAEGSSFVSVLDESYYVYLDNVSVLLSAVDNNSGSSVYNYTSAVTILGYPTFSISNLDVVSVFKSFVVLDWVNPANYNSTRGFIDGSPVFNNNVSSYNFSGLATGTAYNFSFTTISNTFVENTTKTYLVQATDPNYPPNITGYNPTDLTPDFEENTIQSFNVTATDEDGSVWYKWLLDGIVQSFNSVWNWVIGYDDQGVHNVTVIVNDTYGDESSVYWSVTVDDTFTVPTGASIYLFGKTFRNNIPVSCFENNIRNMYYDLAVSVNGGSYSSLFVNKTVCDYVFDIDSYDFGTNFSFRAKSRNIIGDSNYTYSANVTKAKKELFYIYLDDDPKPFTPYNVGFVANFNNNNSVYIAYAFIDCNGDKVYDYAFDYNSTDSTELYNRVNQRFVCVNSKGSFTHNVYLVFGSTSASTDWSSVGCNAKANDDFCYINKAYKVVVS